MIQNKTGQSFNKVVLGLRKAKLKKPRFFCKTKRPVDNFLIKVDDLLHLSPESVIKHGKFKLEFYIARASVSSKSTLKSRHDFNDGHLI